MKGTCCVAGAMMLAGAAYAAAPLVTLWHLSRAICDGDSHTLESMVDWDAVRSGLKDDVAAGLVGAPSEEPETANPGSIGDGHVHATAQTAGAALPPFGASFMSGIAGAFIDQQVTPQHLVASLRVLAPEDAGSGPSLFQALHGLDHAYFDGPANFILVLHCPGQDADEEPLRLRLHLSAEGWHVVRAWVPQDLIDRANART